MQRFTNPVEAGSLPPGVVPEGMEYGLGPGLPGFGAPSVAAARCCGGVDPCPTGGGIDLQQMEALLAQMSAMLTALVMELMLGIMQRGFGGIPGAGAIPGLPGGGSPGGGSPGGGSAGGGAPATGGSSGGSSIPSNQGTSNVQTVMRQGKPIGANLAPNFDRMVAAAKKDGVDLRIESGYRSHAEQVALWNEYGHNPARVARPGTSNHEKGNAIDFANTPGAFQWLKQHATEFGFHNYPPEPWHYSTNGR